MLLSVDTSSSHCVVSLGSSPESGSFFCHEVERRLENGRSHSQILLPLIQELLNKAKIALKDLSGLAVSIGPGSFVGVRLGISVIQGLAYGANLQVWPVSSLQVLAQSLLLENYKNNSENLLQIKKTKIIRDAYMGDLYVGEYQLDGNIMRPLNLDHPDYIEKKSEEYFLETRVYLHPKALHEVAWDSFSHKKGLPPELVSPIYLRGANLWKKQGVENIPI